MEEELGATETDGSFHTEPSSRPQAEVVADLYPESYKASQDAAEKSMSHPAVVKKMTSVLWDMESFDPFQLFKVDQEKCAKLTVFIDNGEGITHGKFHDLIDKPDPYVKMEIKGTPNGKKKTTAIDDNKNPVWNQAFDFLVPDSLSDREYSLELTLMDEDVIKNDKIGSYPINLKALNLKNGEIRSIKATFGNGSVINLRIRKALLDSDPDIRYSLALCDEEKHFLYHRREIIFSAIKNLLGHIKGPMTSKQVPVIGVLGSGGGFRAMVGFSAVFATLWEEGIMDCVSYVAGLSGSTWYLSYLYSHPDFPEKGPSQLKDELKEAVNKSLPLVIAKGIASYLLQLRGKMKFGQPVSLTDLFGHIIGDMILNKRKEATLSSQRRAVYKSKAPLPLYTCLNVKNKVAANVFQDWVEFSPYEIGIAKYGSFIKTEHFGNKFYVGRIVKSFPEMPLHFLQGIWGSGFCILLRRFFKPWKAMAVQINNIYHDCDGDKIVAEAIDSSGFVDDKPSKIDDDSSSESDDDDEVDTFGLIKKRLAMGKKSDSGFKFLDLMKLYLKSLLSDSNLLETRNGRAGLIFNPLRGLKPEQTFPISPFSPTKAEDTLDFKGFYEHTECSVKKMYMVDAGLNFNIPFPVLLRPQRGVELYLSFDFTDRGKDESSPFEELKLAEQWARLNHLPFPPVTLLAKNFEREEMREFYVFEDGNDPFCPVIVHFVLCNKQFRRFKAPGVPRESEAERKYASFNIYDGPDTPYSTFNFHYTSEQFDQLHDLVEFNVRLGLEEIKRQIEAGVARKKIMRPQKPHHVNLSAAPRAKNKGSTGENAHSTLYTNSVTIGELCKASKCK